MLYIHRLALHVRYIRPNFSWLSWSIKPPGWFLLTSSWLIVAYSFLFSSLRNLKLPFDKFFWPSQPLLHQNRVIWNHTFISSPFGVDGLIALLVFNFLRSSGSMAGLCCTLCWPTCFRYFNLASSIMFEFLKAGFLDIWIPLLCGGPFKNLSRPLLKPSNVFLEYSSPFLFLTSA